MNRKALKNENFLASFNRIRDKSLKMAFRNIIFNKLNPKDWREEQKHSVNDNFLYVWPDGYEECVTDTTLAEAAERTLQDKNIRLLINFINSKFQPSSIQVIKNRNNENPVNLDCAEYAHKISEWLKKHLELSRWEYDYDYGRPPADAQTILRDKTRFKRTSKLSPHGKRSIYLEISTNRYWYVDNLHKGTASHLEVFDRTGQQHIGEADLDGNLIPDSSDASKKLNL